MADKPRLLRPACAAILEVEFEVFPWVCNLPEGHSDMHMVVTPERLVAIEWTDAGE
jgi:hypothetical protein